MFQWLKAPKGTSSCRTYTRTRLTWINRNSKVTPKTQTRPNRRQLTIPDLASMLAIQKYEWLRRHSLLHAARHHSIRNGAFQAKMWCIYSHNRPGSNSKNEPGVPGLAVKQSKCFMLLKSMNWHAFSADHSAWCAVRYGCIGDPSTTRLLAWLALRYCTSPRHNSSCCFFLHITIPASLPHNLNFSSLLFTFSPWNSRKS